MHLSSLKNVTASALSILLLGLVACEHKKEDKDTAKGAGRPDMLNAEAYVVKPQEFMSSYTASGTLLPNEEIKILPEISGRVTSISFEEGKHVSKGQTLLKLYNDDVKAQIQKSQSLRELQVKIKNRQAELLRIGGISQQDFETTTAQIQSIDADIAYSQAQLRKTTILAPFDGRVGIRNVSVGAVVTPSTVIATLQQTRILKMDFPVPDQYKKQMEMDKEISFTITGMTDTFKGKISAIEPTADIATRTIKVRALVQNQEHRLVAGAFTHVLIPLEHDKDAILVPSQAIIPTTRDKQVAVVKDGKAKMVTVILGTRTSDKVEVVQGLSQGDTIITTGIMQVKPGMKVKVTKVNS